ncbi:TIGR00251 family protein [Nannocystis exedens]|uniref:UPF0235 protein SAMN02745121_02307 n=1 Tax=Nannocystis exedens TaxID=54 RepID=A0A1I1WF13_9BACT|nr:DUF167 domain-containing protein [Nannocystis exedens]PCC67671.1 hypothetical protein NAEX_00679 [Nannocystis exedens]SFD93754.1 TIGR00251 family protein [Nannocystis exedens]
MSAAQAPASSPGPVRDHARGCELDVLVAPRAARSRVVGLHDGRLKVQLAAPPVDGAANEALRALLADRLEIAASALEIAHGATGRRKTVRVAGVRAAVARGRLGLAALALGLGLSACTVEVPFPVRVVLPDDSTDLNRADNLALELGPDAYFVSYPVRGTDFEVELEFEPDAVERTLALYLADGTELLAWGRSVPFVMLSPPGDLAVLMARPGVLSVYPGEVAEPDPDLLAVHAPGRGLMLMSGAGDIALLNETSFDIELGARLSSPPEPGDGAFVADARGRVWRVGVDDGVGAAMYDPGTDVWAVATVTGDDTGARPGAATVIGPGHDRVYLAGGGGHTDLVALSLEPDDQGVIALAPVAALDGPRTGARLLALDRGDDEVLLLVGGAEADAPAVYFPEGGHAFGPVGDWTNIQCIRLDAGDEDEAATVELLCLGGLRGGQPTGDALVLRVPAAVESTEVEERPAFLSAPLADPRLFADDLAVYAQGAAQWWRVSRKDLAVELTETVATRVHGGHSITLGTGVTFLVGGRDLDDRAVDRWWIFAPSLAPM